MECVRWSNGRLNSPEEELMHEQSAVNLYAKEERTAFQMGKLQLTSHRMLWQDRNDSSCILEFSLSEIKSHELKQIASVSQAGVSLKLSRQIFTRLSLLLERNTNYRAESYLIPDSISATHNSIVQFEFEYGGHNEFYQQLIQQLNRKKWSLKHGQVNSLSNQMHNVGITGIQRKIQEKLDQQDLKIQDSFRDLSILMNQAKEMVDLSNSIISKLNKEALAKSSEEDNDSEDMKKLKLYFLNIGLIDNPVTKESSGSKYYKNLASEIYNNMSKIVNNNGGIMTLADVFCVLNRARGMGGLISPDDLLMACRELNKLNHNLKYNVYSDLNLHVLEIDSTQANSKKLNGIVDLVDRNEHLTAYNLSKILNCSLIVAKKHLLDAERCGMLCRDDTNMGLKFYKNFFLFK
jgi:ESCRT-II complex subunit VPS36